MSTSRPPGTVRRRTGTVAAAIGVALLLSAPLAAVAAPAGAQVTGRSSSSGYLRAAHLVPDLPAMDVTLSRFAGAVGSQQTPLLTIEAAYGNVGTYAPVAPGFYAVSLRPAGSPASAAPILETTLEVEAGGSYTAAGVGTSADARLAVFADDLTMPEGGSARVRVVNAARNASPSDVVVNDGTQVAQGAAYAVPTSYARVPAGPWRLTASSSAGVSPRVTGVSDVTLDPGAVYTLLVLESAGGALRVLPVLDAAGTGVTPRGGAATGFGGASAGAGPTTGPADTGAPGWLLAVAGAAGAVALAGGWAMRRDRTR